MCFHICLDSHQCVVVFIHTGSITQYPANVAVLNANNVWKKNARVGERQNMQVL